MPQTRHHHLISIFWLLYLLPFLGSCAHKSPFSEEQRQQNPYTTLSPGVTRITSSLDFLEKERPKILNSIREQWGTHSVLNLNQVNQSPTVPTWGLSSPLDFIFDAGQAWWLPSVYAGQGAWWEDLIMLMIGEQIIMQEQSLKFYASDSCLRSYRQGLSSTPHQHTPPPLPIRSESQQKDLNDLWRWSWAQETQDKETTLYSKHLRRQAEPQHNEHKNISGWTEVWALNSSQCTELQKLLAGHPWQSKLRCSYTEARLLVDFQHFRPLREHYVEERFLNMTTHWMCERLAQWQAPQFAPQLKLELQAALQPRTTLFQRLLSTAHNEAAKIREAYLMLN